MTKHSIKNRTRIRFVPEGLDFGYVSFELQNFANPITVLLINESIHGACFVINQKRLPANTTLRRGDRLILKIGNLEPLIVVIRWAIIFDEDVIKIGVENTEERHEIKFP
jgi:hypothetical protein